MFLTARAALWLTAFMNLSRGAPAPVVLGTPRGALTVWVALLDRGKVGPSTGSFFTGIGPLLSEVAFAMGVSGTWPLPDSACFPASEPVRQGVAPGRSFSTSSGSRACSRLAFLAAG